MPLANDAYPINVPTKIDTSIFTTLAVNQIVCDPPDGNMLAVSTNNSTLNFTGDVGNTSTSGIYNPFVGTRVKYVEAVEIVFQGTNVVSAQNQSSTASSWIQLLFGWDG